jgi:hypothetical protein
MKLAAIARICGISPGALLGGRDAPQPGIAQRLRITVRRLNARLLIAAVLPCRSRWRQCSAPAALVYK